MKIDFLDGDNIIKNYRLEIRLNNQFESNTPSLIETRAREMLELIKQNFKNNLI